MDVLAACRVLVQLEAQGTISTAAAAAGVPQSVASRRLAALEEHLGVVLVDRAGRRSTISDSGRRLLPTVRRLVQLADALTTEVDSIRSRPRILAVPDGCPDRAAAALDAASWAQHAPLEVRVMTLSARRDALVSAAVDVALLPAVAEQARWHVPLGCASRQPLDRARLRLEALRPSRSGRGPSSAAPLAGVRIHLCPEDDVPHLRDVLQRAAAAEGLRADAVIVGRSRTAAIGAVLGRGDLALLGEAETIALGLHWTPLAEVELVRGYRLVGGDRTDEESVHERFRLEIGACVGATA